jgi:hypothetical protein
MIKFTKSDTIPKPGEVYWGIGIYGKGILSLAIGINSDTIPLRKAIQRKYGDWSVEYYLPEGQKAIEWKLKEGNKALKRIRKLARNLLKKAHSK